MHLTMLRRSALALLASATLLTATPASGAVRHEVMVTTHHNAKYGTFLVTMRGLALYTYRADKPNRSNCNGTCLAAWPALTVKKGVVPIGRGVKGIGVFRRSNGTFQVTWDKKPLYRFISDTKPYVVTGQGVAGFSLARLGVKASSTTTTTGAYKY